MGLSSPSPKAEVRHGDERPSERSPTLRDAVPWGALEKKLADRLAAKAALVESVNESNTPSKPWNVTPRTPPPESGVRMTIANDDAPRALTYSVYTINELDAVARKSLSSVAAATTAPRPSSWRDLQRSVLTLAQTFWRSWLRASPRPRIDDVCKLPLLQVLTDLETVLRRAHWKKIAFVAGTAVVTLFVLLVSVLAIAEVTDDLKPSSSSSAVGERASLSTSSSFTAAPEVSVASPPAAVVPAVETIEIEEAAPATPTAKTTAAAKKPTPRGAKKDEVEIFIP